MDDYMKRLSFVLISSIAFTIAACGDSGKATSGLQKVSNADMEVRTYSELPSCVEKRNGKTAYVADQEQGYICTNGKWIEDDYDNAVFPSSSNITPQSSFSVTKVSSSSSLVPRISCNVNTDENCMKDSRDSQTYKTVTIGTQTWMAQNLNYEPNSYCYYDNAYNCTKYGRFYTWTAATTACPKGWRLPTQAEWNTLITAVGGQSTAGKMLKSTSGWRFNGNGTDAYAFSALPAGSTFGSGNYNFEGDHAKFWSSTEYNISSAYCMSLYYDSDDVGLVSFDKSGWFSVRCLRDDGVPSSSKALEPVEGTFIDSRDGQTYKTVSISTQTWMAENLNFAYTGVSYKYIGDTSDSISWCYDNDASNCTKYGRLYTWAAAMDSAGTWTTNGKGCGYSSICSPTYPVRGVCPEGWHLPTKPEFEALITTVGGPGTAGKMLKSKSGWNISIVKESGTSTDAYAFSALPAGYRSSTGNHNYFNEGDFAKFWISTEYSRSDAYSMTFYYTLDNASLSNSVKYTGYSVRCVEDD